MKNAENHNEPDLKIEGISESELKRNAFKVPSGYFENLTPRVMESVRTSEQSSANPKFSWNHILIPSFGIAAVALVGLLFYNPTENVNPNFDQVLASLTVEEIADYADLQPSELVSYDLVDYDKIALEENSFSDDEIIEYLSNEEEIELNALIDEIEI
jgi:hypothetical protein